MKSFNWEISDVTYMCNTKPVENLVGCVLQHINPCELFNVKSCLYIYTQYI